MNLKKILALNFALALPALTMSSCVVNNHSTAQMARLSSIAGIFVDEEDAAALEALETIGEILIVGESCK